jgi:DHA3 family macrolide efflux protein-like MFS transporter
LDTTKVNWKKNIILFLSGQAISFFGSALVQYAITWYITLKTQSGIMMTISIICGFVPTFLISPFAGVWADRYDRKKLVMLSDSLIAVSTLIMAFIFLTGYGSTWMLFAVSVIRSFGSGVQMPAAAAILPDIVPEDKLTKVNGVNGTIQSLVTLLSPMLSGVLLTYARIEYIFFIDVVTAFIAVMILLIFLHIPRHAGAEEKKQLSYFSDMMEGIRYIGDHAFIKTAFLFCAFYFVLVAPLAFLTPLQVTRSYGDDVWRLSAIEMSFSIGMMAGGLIIAAWGGFKNKLHTMVLSNLAIAFCTIGLGGICHFVIYLVLMGIVGMCMPIFNTPFTVMLQQKVEPNYLGRVFGVLNMISCSIMPLSMLIFGPVADFADIELLLIITGALMLVQGLLMMANKVLIEAGKPVVQAVPGNTGEPVGQPVSANASEDDK